MTVDEIINEIVKTQRRLAQLDKMLEEAKAAQQAEPTLESLGFSARILNCLASYEITTVKQLRAMSREELLKLRNLGATSLKQIEEALK